MTPRIKDVAETLVYEFPFDRDLGGETIAELLEVASIVQPGSDGEALSVTRQSFEGKRVRVEIDGGTDGGQYQVAVKVRDSGNRVFRLAQEFVGLDLAWSKPEGAGRYLPLADFIEQAGIERTVHLTDELGRGTPDPERLGKAIAGAEAEVDAYLAGRYQTPLAETPELIQTLVFDLAHARLYRNEAPEGVASRASEARKTLDRLSKGTMTLPNAAAQVAAPSTSPVKIAGGQRAYPPGSLDGFVRG